VYYGGHGSTQLVDGSHELIVFGGYDGPTANWASAEHALNVAESDVLLILDCSYAGIVGTKRVASATDRFYELLAATGDNHKALAPGPASFTHTLLDSLRELLKEGQPFNTLALHNRMLSRQRDLPQSRLISRIDSNVPRPIVLACRMVQSLHDDAIRATNAEKNDGFRFFIVDNPDKFKDKDEVRKNRRHVMHDYLNKESKRPAQRMTSHSHLRKDTDRPAVGTSGNHADLFYGDLTTDLASEHADISYVATTADSGFFSGLQQDGPDSNLYAGLGNDDMSIVTDDQQSGLLKDTKTQLESLFASELLGHLELHLEEQKSRLKGMLSIVPEMLRCFSILLGKRSQSEKEAEAVTFVRHSRLYVAVSHTSRER